MNVYVETNFVLELALVQEQQAACYEIVNLAESGEVALVIPAYCFLEAQLALRQKNNGRKKLRNELDKEFTQLRRTAPYTQQLGDFQGLTALLIESADEDTKRLEAERETLLRVCELVSLDRNCIASAAALQGRHDLSPQDALVYASVLSHLEGSRREPSCFLNRNSRDFDDPEIVTELASHLCTLIPSFDDGLEHVRANLRQADDPPA